MNLSPSDSPKKPYRHKCDQINFANLPTEVLLKIFLYTDSKTVHNGLYHTCTRFQSILDDSFYWHEKFFTKYTRDNHLIKFVPPDEEIDWHALCYEQDLNLDLWTNHEKNFRPFSMQNLHIGSVDVVHLFDNSRFLVTGSRDRNIFVTNLEKAASMDSAGSNEAQVVRLSGAHGGWIWSIISQDKSIFSGSWDNTIKRWEVTESTLTALNEIRCQHAVISLAIYENILAAGFWSESIKLYDTRAMDESPVDLKLHIRAVLDLKVMGYHLYSVGEDKTIGVYDLRNRKKIKRIVLPNTETARKICCTSEVIYVGGTRGQFYVIDPNYHELSVVESYTLAKQHITGIIAQKGVVIISSVDGSIEVRLPHEPMPSVASIKPDFQSVVSLDYNNGVLAAGGSEGSVQFWYSPESV